MHAQKTTKFNTSNVNSVYVWLGSRDASHCLNVCISRGFLGKLLVRVTNCFSWFKRLYFSEVLKKTHG